VQVFGGWENIMAKLTKLLLSGLVVSVFSVRLCAGTGLEQLQSAAPQWQPVAPEPVLKNAGSGGPAAAARPGSFAAAADKAYRHYPNYITLQTIPSPHPMDWSTISSLSASFVRNQWLVKTAKQTNAIGHVTFEVGCTLPDGSRSLVMSGQVPVKMSKFMAQVKEGAGFGALFGHVPGRLQTRAEVETKLDMLSNIQGEAALVTLKVSGESCLEAQRYVKAYQDEGVATRYGLGVRPLYKEGGGCANVGVSVVEVGGPANFSGLSSPWSRTFYIPDALLGNVQNPVGVTDIAHYWKYDWSKKPASAHRKLFFYDPDLIYNWVQTAYDSKTAENRTVERYLINKSRGVTLDYTMDSRPSVWWRTDAE